MSPVAGDLGSMMQMGPLGMNMPAMGSNMGLGGMGSIGMAGIRPNMPGMTSLHAGSRVSLPSVQGGIDAGKITSAAAAGGASGGEPAGPTQPPLQQQMPDPMRARGEAFVKGLELLLLHGISICILPA